MTAIHIKGATTSAEARTACNAAYDMQQKTLHTRTAIFEHKQTDPNGVRWHLKRSRKGNVTITRVPSGEVEG